MSEGSNRVIRRVELKVYVNLFSLGVDGSRRDVAPTLIANLNLHDPRQILNKIGWLVSLLNMYFKEHDICFDVDSICELNSGSMQPLRCCWEYLELEGVILVLDEPIKNVINRA